MEVKREDSNSEEVCSPLDTVDQLLAYKCIPNLNILPLQPSSVACYTLDSSFRRNFLRKTVPKTLVCHDLQGGYLADKFVNGCDQAHAYRFFHWSAVDIFVYFSHHFVTIPPIGWINAGHLHGVPVLGTFITEWDEGKKICQEIFSSRSAVDSVVSKLVALTTNRFDGWLINIENALEETWVPNVVYFLEQLRSKLKSQSENDTYVIWYDSVTHSGELEWQNELNLNNKNFFDASDGIFLNYCWKEEHLQRSKAEAGSRELDVFVGVDVFGRGCLGGGGFNTKEAMKVIRDHGLSAAIFAPGWAYETQGIKDFLANELEFWNLLTPYLYVHTVAKLPLQTYFCQGFGNQLYNSGKVVSCLPWYNLCKQNLQSSYLRQGLSFDTSLGINGGGCLEMNATTKERFFPLLAAEVPTGLKVRTIRVLIAYCLENATTFTFGYHLKGEKFESECRMGVSPSSETIADHFPSLEDPNWVLKQFKIDLECSIQECSNSETSVPLFVHLELVLEPGSVMKIGYLGIFDD